MQGEPVQGGDDLEIPKRNRERGLRHWARREPQYEEANQDDAAHDGAQDERPGRVSWQSRPSGALDAGVVEPKVPGL